MYCTWTYPERIWLSIRGVRIRDHVLVIIIKSINCLVVEHNMFIEFNDAAPCIKRGSL